MIIPNDNFVTSWAKYKHNKVCLVHHFNYFNRLVQVLDLLLYLVTTGIVLDDLKASLSSHCKVLLWLIGGYVFDKGSIWGNVGLSHSLHCIFVDKTLFGVHHLSGWSWWVLRHTHWFTVFVLWVRDAFHTFIDYLRLDLVCKSWIIATGLVVVICRNHFCSGHHCDGFDHYCSYIKDL